MKNELPKGWVETSLQELQMLVIGGDWGIDANEINSAYTKCKVIRGTDFRYWNEQKTAKSAIRNIKHTSLEKRQLKIGDIVIEVSGGGPDQPVGRTIIIDDKLFEQESLPMVCSNFFRKVSLSKEVNPYYINYYLNHAYSEGAYNDIQSHTTNLRNLRVEEYLQSKLLLAPLAEQNRIVAKLDAILARVNNSKARLEKIPALLKNFRQSVLAAAASGELTKEWRENNDIESVEKYLKKINREFKDYSFDENNWVLTQVENIYKAFGGGTPSRSEKSYWNGSIAWVSSGDVKNDFIEKGSETITKKGLENSTAKLCPVNSVIVVVRSGILQHTFPVSIVKKEISINQDLKCFDSSDETLNYWLFLVFKARQREILSFNREGTTVQSVKMDTLNKLEIKIPSLEEQKEIVRKVESLFHFADRIEARYQKAKAWFDKLLQSILAKAFRGELVPQDENDEPASELLKRIQQAKQTNHKPSSKATLRQAQGKKQRKMYEDNDELSLVAEE